MHPFAIDPEGGLFIDLGSATNACEEKNRMPQSPGRQPCTELETRGGTWRYDANKTDQKFSPTERFATGIRNGEGFSFDASGRLFVTQHGRDQLHEDWPKLYTAEQGQNENLPAEEVVLLQRGGDYGWPECYFDGYQQKLVLPPNMAAMAKKMASCAHKRTGCVLPRPLGAELHENLRRIAVSGGLSQRRLHRLSRLVESRSAAAGRL